MGFGWHDMRRELPEYGKRKMLVRGPHGGVYLAREFCTGVREPVFRLIDGRYVRASEASAWSEIPPYEGSHDDEA